MLALVERDDGIRPLALDLLVDREFARIAELLKPGRRATAEAKARVRTLLATEAIAAKLREALSGKLAMPAPAECRRYALRFDWEAVWPNIERVWQEADRR